MCIGGPRRLVCPSRAFAAMASIHQIEKLHTVGTAMIGRRLGGRLQKFHAYRRRRKVMIAVELDRLIAFCYDLTMPRCFHKLSLSSDLGRSETTARRPGASAYARPKVVLRDRLLPERYGLAPTR